MNNPMVSLRVCLVVAPVVLVSIGALKKDTRAPCGKQFGRQSWLYSDVWLLLLVNSAADLLHLFFVELNADVSDYHVALAGLGYLAIVLTTLCVLLKRRASTFEALGFSEAPLAYLVSTLNVISAVVFGTGAVVLMFGALSQRGPAASTGSPFLVQLFVILGSYHHELFDMPLGALSTKILTFLEIVAIGPFVEEAVYRGFMTKPFARKFGTAGGAAFSALLWGVTHEASWGMIGVIVLGLGFSYLYYRTQSLVPSLTIHIVKNVSAYVYLAVSDLHNALGVTVSMTVGGLLAWLVLGWLSRRLRVSPRV